MITIQHAILKLNPSIVTVRGDVAYDANEQEVSYDIKQAENKLAEIQAQAESDAQTAIDAKASALAKLAALGLTQDEVKALVG
jgi:hypothetical protein